MYNVKNEKYEKFQSEVDKFAEENPNDAEIWILRGNLLKSSNNYVQALDSYNKAIKLESKNVEPYFQKFIIYDKFGNFGEALRALKKVIELKPAYLTEFEKKEAFNKIYSTDLQTQTIRKNDLNIDYNQQVADYWYKKSEEFFGIDKIEEALNTINESIFIDSKCAKAWCKKSEVLHYMGQPKEALISIKKSLELDLQCSRSWCKKSAILNDLGHADEALEAAELAIKIDSSFAEAWCQKGIILFYKEKYNDSFKAIKESLQVNPDYSLATSFKKKILVYVTQQRKEIRTYVEPIKTDKSKGNKDTYIRRENCKNIESLTYRKKDECSHNEN